MKKEPASVNKHLQSPEAILAGILPAPMGTIKVMGLKLWVGTQFFGGSQYKLTRKKCITKTAACAHLLLVDYHVHTKKKIVFKRLE